MLPYSPTLPHFLHLISPLSPHPPHLQLSSTAIAVTRLSLIDVAVQDQSSSQRSSASVDNSRKKKQIQFCSTLGPASLPYPCIAYCKVPTPVCNTSSARLNCSIRVCHSSLFASSDNPDHESIPIRTIKPYATAVLIDIGRLPSLDFPAPPTPEPITKCCPCANPLQHCIER